MGGADGTYRRRGSEDERHPSSMSNALCRTLEGMRLSWSAWNPAQLSRFACAEVNLRRPFTTSSLIPDPMYCCLADTVWLTVCWQMGLCDDQCSFWHS